MNQAKKIKARFDKIRSAVSVLSALAIFFCFYSILSNILDVFPCMAGMYCNGAGAYKAALSPFFAVITISYTVFFAFYIAMLVDSLFELIDELEVKQLALADMQTAYLRNAEIKETTDRLNGTYYGKVYLAAVRDIEDALNK